MSSLIHEIEIVVGKIRPVQIKADKLTELTHLVDLCGRANAWRPEDPDFIL